MTLEGKFVEVHSISTDSSFNGATGYCRNCTDGLYDVLTFAGDSVRVGENNIKEIVPASATKGGFDVFWLAQQDEERLPDPLAAKVATAVQQKGYCVIQTVQDKSLQQEAMLAGAHQCTFGAITAEFTEGYLGLNGSSKIAWLDGSHPQQFDPYDDTFSKIGTSLGALGPKFLNLHLSSRSFGMVRKALEDDEVTPEQLNIYDLEEGFLEDYNEFCKTSKILMIYVIDDTGEVTINTGSRETTIPLSSNKLILIQAGVSYTYKPSSTQSMVMQCWLMGESSTERHELAMELIESGEGALANKHKPLGAATNMMSIMIRTPGSVDGDLDMFCVMTYAACDTASHHTSKNRFALEDAPMGEKGEAGKMYNLHAAYKENDYPLLFDAAFFGYDEHEMAATSKECTVYFETAYQALHKAGHTKKTLSGYDIGLYCGTNGSCGDIMDMVGRAFLAGEDQYLLRGINPGFMMARFSSWLNSIGTAQAVDTACSASLVAIALPDKDFKINRSAEKCEALSGGVNVMTGFGPHYFFSTIGALSAKGRSFTFDHHVDGYLRGEGCCQTVLRRGDSQTWKADLAASFGTVLGCTAGSDGKSASLTAPSGPAQQACMRHSMAMAGITIHEAPGNECHGTGTPLGDPIEMGSVKSLWKSSATPVGVTSRKTFFGHTEANAGIAGICGCLIMIDKQMGVPNIHLREVSGLLDLQGFMTQFWTEVTQFHTPNAYVGVNSFGIGGTNARADLWASKGSGLLNSPEKLQTVEALSVVAEPQQVVAERLDDEEPERLHVSDHIYVVGTWDSGKVPLEMSPERDDIYTAVVQLGEEHCEQFHVMVGPEGLEAKARPAPSKALKSSQPQLSLLEEEDSTPEPDIEDGGEPEQTVVDMICNMMGSVEYGLLADDDFLAWAAIKTADTLQVEADEPSPELGMTFLPAAPHIIYQRENPPPKPEKVETDQGKPKVVEEAEKDVESAVEMQSEAAEEHKVAKRDAQPKALVDEASFLDDLILLPPDPQPLNTAQSLLDVGLFADHPHDDEDVRADFAMLAEVVAGLDFDAGTMDVEDDGEIIDFTTLVKADIPLPMFPMERRKFRYETRDSSVVPANKKELRFIYPSETASSSSSRMFGPDVLRRDERWLLDGKGLTNAFYRITLNLSADRDERGLVWSPLDEPPSNFLPPVPFTHSYHMLGPSTRGRLRELIFSSTAGCYELSFILNEEGTEEFQLVRDKDMQQAIYPSDKPGTLLGPDAGSGTWIVTGNSGEHVKVSLLVSRGKLAFTVTMSNGSVKFWQS